ncbi:glutamate receptor ionotropic, kainate glr-3-like isoform X2 [Mya arenaria]|uniref:glutamate receptor ionotropic, kainate glr-3-like isoform X2 n=1 Tax=Mya arenaria TaxID=6604 RepID=UPI0022E256D0|nr:glutamate receptor ionotropic, kainate glr-3-like isoform X2 [Mya arenaria]
MTITWKTLNYLSLLVLVNGTSVCEPKTTLNIGVISNGSGIVKTDIICNFTYNVTINWHYIDTTEVFQIHKSVEIMDSDETVDVILLFDYAPTTLEIKGLYETKNKELIKWGERLETPVPNTSTANEPTNLCGDEYIPDLMFGDPYCKMDLNYSVYNGAGPGDPLKKSVTMAAPKALSSFVKHLQWKTVLLLHNNQTELEASHTMEHLSDNGVMFAVFNVDHVTDLYELLHMAYQQTVPKTHTLNIVVLCPFICARKLLRTANQFDSVISRRKTLMRQFSRWLVAVYGHSVGVSRALQACANDLDNVAILAVPEIIGDMTDFRDIMVNIILDEYRSEISGTNIGTTHKENLIAMLKQEASTWSPVSKCQGFYIDTLIWTDKGRQFSSAGFMDLSGNTVIKADIFPNTKYGYNKRQFLVATLPYPPFVWRKELNGTTYYEGFCIDLLDQLAHTLNFTYTITEPADQAWGGWLDKEKGLFNGLVGMLQREEVDLTVGPLSQQAEREKAIDFSYPFFYEYTTVLFKKPDPNARKWRTLVDPFKWQVLLCIIIALPCVTTITFLMEKYNPYYYELAHAQERDRNGGLHTWHNAFWYMYGALLCQGGVHLPDSHAGRTIVSSWWLFCIVVVGIYSGNLIAFLTVTKESPPFTTLEELVKLKGTYKWGTLGGTHWENLFTSSHTEPYKSIGDGLREFNRTDPTILHPSAEFHVQRVLVDEHYAWIGDQVFTEITVANRCELMDIKQKFMPLRLAIGLVNDSPNSQIISKQMMQIHEGGLLQIWKRRWWPKANFCAKQITTEENPIAIADVQSAFYVCVIGIFIGTVAFVMEICIDKYRKCKEKTPRTPNLPKNVTCAVLTVTSNSRRETHIGESTERNGSMYNNHVNNGTLS